MPPATWTTLPKRARLVVLSAGVSDPSSTRLLADRLAQKSVEQLHRAGVSAMVDTIELGPLAVSIAHATTAGFPDEQLQKAIRSLADADAVIAATPVYKAGTSGLFKSFVDVLDNDLLVAKPILLAATAGTSRHALVVDDQMRQLFAYMRTLTLPTAVFAAPEDWGSAELGTRIERAANELAALVRSGAGSLITEQAWNSYQHEFDSNAARPTQGSTSIDVNTALMRLAAGGAIPRSVYDGEVDSDDSAA
ncbi:CE1759 family FMN reductase [Nocardia terrae]|uniref:CE1759 family FMN reductase n=1 Tax=Nocardia terrae TaxID=2675851 RepID=UPI0038B3F69B